MYKKPSNTEALTCDNIVLSMAVINWRRRRFSRSFKVFSLTYTKINFLFSSLKLLTNSEMLAETLLFCARQHILHQGLKAPSNFSSYFCASQKLPALTTPVCLGLLKVHLHILTQPFTAEEFLNANAHRTFLQSQVYLSREED